MALEWIGPGQFLIRARECEFELVTQEPLKSRQALQSVDNYDTTVPGFGDVEDRQRQSHEARFDESRLFFDPPKEILSGNRTQVISISVDSPNHLADGPLLSAHEDGVKLVVTPTN